MGLRLGGILGGVGWRWVCRIQDRVMVGKGDRGGTARAIWFSCFAIGGWKTTGRISKGIRSKRERRVKVDVFLRVDSSVGRKPR